MIILPPLPQPGQPIVGANAPTQPYVQYWQSLDQVTRGLLYSGINKQTGTNYNIAATDAAGIIEMNNAAGNTVTILNDNTVPFNTGTRIRIVQTGAGATTITAGAGVTLRSHLGDQLAAQWAVAEIYKRAANEWVAFGDLV